MEKRKRRGAPGAPLRENHKGLPIFYFLFSILLTTPAFTGCAAPAEPYERKPPTPASVADLSVTRAGNDVILSFSMPQQTADRRPLEQAPAIEIYRDFQKAQESARPQAVLPVHPTLLATIPAAMQDRYTEQGHIRYTDSLRAEDFAQHPDSIAVYDVRTQVSEKKPSADSNLVLVRIEPAADAITDLKTEVTHSAVALSWTAPQKTLTGSAPVVDSYRIYRGEADAGATSTEPLNLKSPLVKIGECQSPSYQDVQSEFGKTYAYSVRSVIQFPAEALESGDSNLAIVTPRDTFPPAMPQGLLVVLVPAQGAVPGHLELSWAINPETDIAGYNVYRSDQAGTSGNRLNTELLLTPAFRDMNVQPGHRYFYTVSAVDRAGNESPTSAVVAGGVPAESQATP